MGTTRADSRGDAGRLRGPWWGLGGGNCNAGGGAPDPRTTRETINERSGHSLKVHSVKRFVVSFLDLRSRPRAG